MNKDNLTSPSVTPFPVQSLPRAEDELSGVDAVRLEQAMRLQKSVAASCWTVEAVIVYIMILIIADGSLAFSAAWAMGTSAMVLVVYLYSKFLYPDEINHTNYQSYLRGHVWVSAATGCVWSSFAIYQLNPDSLLSLFIAASIASTITLGGMVPSSAYRSTFTALLTCNVLPIGLYWFIAVPGLTKFFAFGFIVYYLFGLMTSARTEINMRDLILAKQAKQLNEELKSHNQEVEDSNAEKTRFMVSTVHDFSQPQHALGYFIHGLRNLLTDEKQFDMLDRIESSWRSQGELLKGIAEITQLDSGLIEPRVMRVEIESVLENVADEFRGDAKTNQINFVIDATPTVVETDPALLARVLRNLLSNAFKHTPAGGEIKLETRIQNAQVMINISDNGAGIAIEDQELIFDEYVQLASNPRGAKSGLGLGLSIVKRLATLLNVSIKLDSTPGQGTSFTLGILASADQSQERTYNPQNTRLSSTPCVFLVAPEEHIRDGMAALLIDWGCAVVCASSRSEALTILGEMDHIPSLLLIDNRLERGDSGIDLIHALRDEVNESLPAVLMTGDIESTSVLNELEDVTIMIKPVEPDDLREFIQTRQAKHDASRQESA